jgi:transposase InsO family protein
MPWKEQRAMSQKMEFVERAMKPGARVSTLCREYGISRETGYKWLKRFKRDGAEGLEERSRRPQASPLATAEEVVAAILELRERYPRRGPKKLVVFLRAKLGESTPSVATIARVLKRFGMVRQRSRFGRAVSIVERRPEMRAVAPNELWTVDFKGWWRSTDGQRCEPLTVRDAFSRFVLAIKVLASTSMTEVRSTFEALFKKYGVPQAIQVDNGVPFINVHARGGLTRLSAWWISLGIRVVRSRPGCPQDNGAHERMHRDMSADLQAFPSGSRSAEQRACDRWRVEFNRVRPHEALSGKTPSELYKSSERRPVKTKFLYPPDWIVRTVMEHGCVSISGARVQAGLALVRERVAFQLLGGSLYRMWFRDLDLGTVDLPPSTAVIDAVVLTHLDHPLRRITRKGRNKKAA